MSVGVIVDYKPRDLRSLMPRSTAFAMRFFFSQLQEFVEKGRGELVIGNREAISGKNGIRARNG